MHILNTHKPLRAFAHRHDDLPAFHAGFLILTLLAAAMFSLGAFGLLIFTHMCLDLVKYREYHGYSWGLTFKGIVRESLMDLTLFMIGLMFAVFLHHSIAFPGISGVMRAEIAVVRMFGTIIPKMKILHNFLKIVAHVRHYLDHAHPHLRKHWSSVDRVCFWSLGLTTLLLVFSAPILQVEYSTVIEILREELVPRLIH
ncbi:MAG: hypothetical protein QF741_03335 [Candidatus Peribacteraceae bacterium]|jgi:hypothetical protein|nr:hypothetical protein [Candidatus Peribacteraceae bacterium]MDP7454031.1 hypothetical protein [Candidatus Peribacteraceae bacterium]MDP7645918.1 hypothetical protein [Candidatus Peribacteraceae bacterium]|tara:strand:+ start:190 stop:786 length:597 start_codon:yes stop_codon:yes gene_type:complete